MAYELTYNEMLCILYQQIQYKPTDYVKVNYGIPVRTQNRIRQRYEELRGEIKNNKDKNEKRAKWIMWNRILNTVREEAGLATRPPKENPF